MTTTPTPRAADTDALNEALDKIQWLSKENKKLRTALMHAKYELVVQDRILRKIQRLIRGDHE